MGPGPSSRDSSDARPAQPAVVEEFRKFYYFLRLLREVEITERPAEEKTREKPKDLGGEDVARVSSPPLTFLPPLSQFSQEEEMFRPKICSPEVVDCNETANALPNARRELIRRRAATRRDKRRNCTRRIEGRRWPDSQKPPIWLRVRSSTRR